MHWIYSNRDIQVLVSEPLITGLYPLMARINLHSHCSIGCVICHLIKTGKQKLLYDARVNIEKWEQNGHRKKTL